ncbi:signal transducer and activator of transcription 6 [Melanotaenia boesemani]|uniref:signal transducer and activator of transcription 6 n=1 Tax=Melanotaenia boesemani TaxID=1250792 RepID=UPI001C03B189|nr:signal transducer and activator of transcription 6 [Melanotaenia boesemani]
MAQWAHMTKLVQCLSDETVNSLYPPTTFPIEVRHYVAEWIESERWEDFSLEKMELESQAQTLLTQIISMLQMVAQQNVNVVDKMKLMQMSRNMGMFQQQPLKFAVMVRDILRQERALIGTYQTFPAREPSTQDVDHLVQKVYDVQEIRKKMHQLQEELNWERQNYESLQVSYQPNGLESSKGEISKIQKKIQQLEFNMNAMASNRFQLLRECVDCLDHCQGKFISKIKSWRAEQHRAVIGFPFDENLTPLQTWSEQLLGMNGNLRQELMLIGEPISDLQERLGKLLQLLIESALVVEKQPPQVIKTQSKFSTTVRYLLGEKVAPGKPMVLKAQIVNEMQARNMGFVPGDNVGELINASAILEHNTTTKSTCATFRNMSIKKIKRADRKGSESVTEEKFAFLFCTEITITGCDTPYRIQTISHPTVVIVHGSQDNNAMATIIWDCAFSEPDRIPFVVPERVPWRSMCETLNMKFVSEVQTDHNLDQFNQHFLAQKIFDKPDYIGDFSNMMVSWAQFNKEVLPGRTFTFWQWFEGAMELTKKHLSKYWSKRLIFGFIGKQHLHLILKDSTNGTFLLRFSDSEIGGITIAYVSASENGVKRIQNIQPFTKKDLEIRSLGDRIRDIQEIAFLYPNLPKNEFFKNFYSEPQQPTITGYIPAILQTKVGPDATAPVTTMAPMHDNTHVAFSSSPFQQFNPVDMSEMMESSAQSPGFLDLQDAASPNPNMSTLGDNLPGFNMSPFSQQFNPVETPDMMRKTMENTSLFPDLNPQFSQQFNAAEISPDVLGKSMENRPVFLDHNPIDNPESDMELIIDALQS